MNWVIYDPEKTIYDNRQRENLERGNTPNNVILPASPHPALTQQALHFTTEHAQPCIRPCQPASPNIGGQILNVGGIILDVSRTILNLYVLYKYKNCIKHDLILYTEKLKLPWCQLCPDWRLQKLS